MQPLIVVDVETTGLPGKTPPDLLRIVEVGAVFVDEWGEIRRSFGEMVNPGAEIVEHDKVQAALAISGLTFEEIKTFGRPELRVAKELLVWVESLPGPRPAVTAYNRDFDMGMLGDGPWRLALSGVPLAPCLMLESMRVMAQHCDVERDDNPLQLVKWKADKGMDDPWKWPKAEEAIAWFRGRGHYIPELRGHRALDDAIMEAHVAVALEKEDRGFTPAEKNRVINVYAAGKVRKDRGGDWRPEAAEVYSGDVEGAGMPTSKVIYDDDGTIINYVGPWVISCDHGCYHGDNKHGLGALEKTTATDEEDCICSGEAPDVQSVVLRSCLEQLRRADVIYVRLDDLTAYGTLVEIGYAGAHGIPFVLDMDMDPDDARHLWFARLLMKSRPADPFTTAAVRSLLSPK